MGFIINTVGWAFINLGEKKNMISFRLLKISFCSGNDRVANNSSTEELEKQYRIRRKYLFEDIEEVPRQLGLECPESWSEKVH